MLHGCYAADESAFGPATDTVLRALAGNLEYLKPVVAEGDQNEEEEFNEELEPGLNFLDTPSSRCKARARRSSRPGLGRYLLQRILMPALSQIHAAAC
jgi:hypothetical protein